jgi:hypothetical protein
MGMGFNGQQQQQGFSGGGGGGGNVDSLSRAPIPENTQLAETDRLVMRPGGQAEPVVPQPGQQRQRLGSKRGSCNTSTEFSPPRTRQKQ